MSNVFHYTDKSGWNAVRVHRFGDSRRVNRRSVRPRCLLHDIEPTQANLRTLHKRLRVPRVKQEYVFWFLKTSTLTQLNGDVVATSGSFSLRSITMSIRSVRNTAVPRMDYGEVPMIGGIDVQIPTSAALHYRPRLPSVRFGSSGRVAELRERPDRRAVSVEFHQIPFGEIQEIFVYRDRASADLWDSEGAIPSALATR